MNKKDPAEAKAFEQLNERIQKLLVGNGANVQWSAEIDDPDKPSEKRQIDVLITSGNGKRSSVECRDRSEAQCVMWIEELIGRKISLGLDGMIAVSVKGFSKLAQVKANRYGITLYDFDRLSDGEIKSWGGVAEVEASFVQFSKLEIGAGILASDMSKLAHDHLETRFMAGNRDGFAAVMDSLRDDVEKKPSTLQPKVLDSSSYTIDGIPLQGLVCFFEGRVVFVKATCTYSALVDKPGTKREVRSTTVQRFDHSVSEVLQHKGSAHLQVDVSKVKSPVNSILHGVKITFPISTQVTQYTLVGDRRMRVDANAIALAVYTVQSDESRELNIR